MRFKSLVFLIGIVTTMVLGEANFTEARGFGRGGGTVRIGIGRNANRTRRYIGPRFYAAPRFNGSYRPGSSQYQMRQWYYSRSGPFEYYRPANTLYRTP